MMARGVFSAATSAGRSSQGVMRVGERAGLGGEGAGDRGRPVEDGDVEALLGDVERQRRAHGAEADQSDFRLHHFPPRGPVGFCRCRRGNLLWAARKASRGPGGGMARLVVRNAARIVTMDGGRRELADASMLVEDGVIRAVGGGGGGGGGGGHRRRGAAW